jgi:hypothetical protein
MAGTYTAPENGSNPTAPSSGYRLLFAKNDGWYEENSSGTVTKLGASISGAFSLADDISPTQITSNQNDYNPTSLSGANTLRLTSDAARDITGLQGGADGRILFIHNVGSFTITLKDESVSSSSANRFALYSDITLQSDTGVIIQYDSTSSRWRAINLASVGGGSFSSFTVAGDGGASQTITDANTLTIAGGTSLTTTGSATDTITIDHDASGVAAATYGAAATVPVIAVNGTGHITSATDTAIAISATAVTSGTLAVARGGTNSTTALNNNRVMQSSAGAIVEAAAITASRALKSDANGIPVHFDTASEPSLTELSYVKGVTSAIQTQLNAKGAGTVTSVAASVPSVLSISGSPITTSGTLAITYSGTALPVANGGTGQTTAQAAIDALMAASGALSQGDVFYYNGTNVVRLGAGTSGHFLKTNGAGANPAWAAASGSGGNYTLLTDSQLTGGAAASISLTSISGSYKHLILIASFRSARANNNDGVAIRLNSASSGYDYVSTYINSGGTTANAAANQTYINFAQAMPAANATASQFGNLFMVINDYANTNKKPNITITGGYGGAEGTSADWYTVNGFGTYRTTGAAISQIDFTSTTSNNFAQYSRVTLYGVD